MTEIIKDTGLDDAVMGGIQTSVEYSNDGRTGHLFHPNANALVMIGFRTAIGAEKFHKWYLKQRYALQDERFRND